MATITFEGYMGAGPAWADLGANTLVFSSSLTDLATSITVSSYQDGTHAGNGDPGTDQCGANHMNNVKYLTSGTMSVNGGGSESIDDTNLTANECTLRLHFNHTVSVAVTNARAYIYKTSVGVTTKADNLTVYAFERGETATAWTLINDTGTTGGDNTGERLDLANSASAADHYWYIALSISPATVGPHTDVDLGMALTYS